MPAKKTNYTAAERAAYGRKMARSRGTIKGRGSYWGDVKRAVPKGSSSALAALLGGALGTPFGLSAPGATIGGVLGQKFADYTGFGAYHTSKNSILAPQNARIRNNGPHNDSVIVRHREYLGDVLSSTTFVKRFNLDLNPGLTQFPWVSGVANNYQIFRMHGCLFEYQPMSGTAISGTNATLGQVLMSSSHNAFETQESKQEMLNSNFSVSVAPSGKAILPIECDPKIIQNDSWYVRDGPSPEGADKRLSTPCVVNVATSDCPDTGSILGQLFVTYEFEFSMPKLGFSTGDLIHSTYITADGTASITNPFGTTARVVHSDSIGVTFPTTDSITLPPNSDGKYLMCIQWVGNTTVDVKGPDVLTTDNITYVKVFQKGTGWTRRTYLSAGNAAAEVYYTLAFRATDSSKECTIQLDNLTGPLPAVNTETTILITQLDDDIPE